jgi:predicted DNA-binding protein with PD1-like motif
VKGIMKSYCNQLTLLNVLALTLFTSMTEMKAQQRDAGQEEAYLPPTATVATGKAPGMKVRLLAENGGVKNYAIVLAKGDEVMSGLTDFARQNKVTSASFTAIGAFSHASVAWFDRTKKEYKLIPIKQQVELISMIGDIALVNGQPVVHTHVSLGSSDGTVRGGHLIEAHVFPTLELFMTVYPTALHKQPDEATGLELINPSSK